uniref:Protein kinase domain-containing protein n=1 Tax=Percolomonas cosmopolitus TaxID=63605 RepID=A0A7S1KRB2_9EUKA
MFNQPYFSLIKNITLMGLSDDPLLLGPKFTMRFSSVTHVHVENIRFPLGTIQPPVHGSSGAFLFIGGAPVTGDPSITFRNILIDDNVSQQQDAFIMINSQYLRQFILENVEATFSNVSEAEYRPYEKAKRQSFVSFWHPHADIKKAVFRNIHVEGLSHYFLYSDETKDRASYFGSIHLDNVTLSAALHVGHVQLYAFRINELRIENSHFSIGNIALMLNVHDMETTIIERSTFESFHTVFTFQCHRIKDMATFSDCVFRDIFLRGLWFNFLSVTSADLQGHFNLLMANVQFDLRAKKYDEYAVLISFSSKVYRTVVLANYIESNAPIVVNSPYVYFEMDNGYFHDFPFEAPMLYLQSDNGDTFVRNSVFERVGRGVRLAISAQYISDATVTGCTFRDIFFEAPEDTPPPVSFHQQLGGALFVSSQVVRVHNNTFQNNTFVSQSFETHGIRNSRLGTVAIWMDYPIDVMISDNTFDSNTADVGGAILIWSDIVSNGAPASVANNTFVANRAFIGAAISVFNNLIFEGVNIVENLFERNVASSNAIVYFRTFIQTDAAVISKNIFQDNYSPSPVSHVIDFSFGSITNTRIESNVFDGNHMKSEIHGTLTSFEGHIVDTIFRNSHRDTFISTQHITFSVEIMNDFTVSHVYMEDDSKELLKIQSGSVCSAVHIDTIFVAGRSESTEPLFVTIACGRLGDIHMSNISAYGRLTVEQNEPEESPNSHQQNEGTRIQRGLSAPDNAHSAEVIIEDAIISGGFGTSNLLRLANVRDALIRNCILGFVVGNKGSMLWSVQSNVRLVGSQLKNGRSTTGGCIYAIGGSLIVEDSDIMDCRAEAGGGIFVEGLDLFQMNQSRVSQTFTNNNGGSLVVRRSRQIILESTQFSSSEAQQEGGCVYLSDFFQLQLNNLSFVDCNSLTVGGGILIDSQNATDVDCGEMSFERCTATSTGGAIYVEQYFPSIKEALLVERFKFDGCTAAFQDRLGSVPVEIHLTDQTIFDAPPLLNNLNPNSNTLYAVATVNTRYGVLKRVQSAMQIINLASESSRPPFCYNGPRLTLEEYCFSYEYTYLKFDFVGQHQSYRLVFDQKFRLGHSQLIKTIDVYIPPIWGSLLALGSMIMGAVFLCCCCSIMICCLPMVFLAFALVKTKKKAETADMELSLLRFRFDQEQLLDDDGNRAKLKLNQDLFEIKFSDVKLMEKIGSGGSGAVVMRGIWRGEQIALKIFKTSYMTDEIFISDFENEANLLASLHHPNIVRFYGALLDHPRIGIITEYHPSSVSKLIRSGKSKELSWIEKMTLLNETVTAMEYLVSCKVIHRDLKWENVLLSESGKARLTDLGLSRIMNDANARGLTARVGTSYLIAPEVVKGLDYDWRCDIFSLGMMCWELLTDTMEPFGNTPGIEYKIATDPMMRPDLHNIQITSDKAWYITLMKRCWNQDPDRRPSFTEIREVLEEEIGGLDEKQLHMHCTFDGEIIIGKEAIAEHIESTPASREESFLMGSVRENDNVREVENFERSALLSEGGDKDDLSADEIEDLMDSELQDVVE